MTYREFVYMCLDEIKLLTDDSYITEDHVLFLIGKYRSLALYKKYSESNLPVSTSNFQEFKIRLEPATNVGKNIAYKSTIPVPKMMISFAKPKVFQSYYDNEIFFVPQERMKYVKNTKWLTNQTYCSLYSDNYMYFTTGIMFQSTETTPAKININKDLTIYALFDDIIEVSKANTEDDDIMDLECPIENELVSVVQEFIVKDLVGAAYRPKDFSNDANDDLSKVALATSSAKTKE